MATKVLPPIETWGVSAQGGKLLVNPSPSLLDRDTYALDVETDERDNLVCLCLATDKDAYVFDTLTLELRKKLSDLKLVGHGIKADIKWLRMWGVPIKDSQLVFDTMIGAYVLDSTKQKYGLKALASEMLDMHYPSYRQMVNGFGKGHTTLDMVDAAQVHNYNANDAIATYRIYQQLEPKLSEKQWDYLETLEAPTAQVLAEIESRGMLIDVDKAHELAMKFGYEMTRIVSLIQEEAPSIKNVNSNAQVGKHLISLGMDLPQTKTGKAAVNKKALEKYRQVPLIKLLLRYSEVEKLKSTYTDVLLEKSPNPEARTYRLHAYFNQCATNTGRLSSSGPNLQNIPTRTDDGALIRECFIAPPGSVLVDADYSQIEPRIMAHYSQDPVMLQIFRDGEDLYDAISKYVGCERAVAKILWLALAYNAGAYKIAEIAGISVNQAFRFLDKMKERFPALFYWKDLTIKKAEKDGFILTLFGRRIELPPGQTSKGTNYVVQGSASEVMKLALIATSQYSPISTIHDEIIFERPEGQECVSQITRAMTGVITLSVPLVVKVGVGKSWAEAKA